MIHGLVANLWAFPHRLLIMRASWVAPRKGQANVSQLHFARQGDLTQGMTHVATQENLLNLYCALWQLHSM